MIMRLVVVVLAVLAAAKVWSQDQIYRAATEEALVTAYRPKAIEACSALPVPEMAVARSDTARRAIAQAWLQPSTTRIVIGNPDVNVRFWQVDHTAWDVRFRHPNLVLDAGEPRPIVRCSYDMTLGRASISAL